jgi:hypothetical protein
MAKPIPRPLMVIVVPPDTIVNGRKLSDTFDVVVGDCVLPGFVAAKFPDAEQADVYALAYGQELGMSVLPLTGRPWRDTTSALRGDDGEG